MSKNYLTMPPAKPFDGYRWKWATVTCTESLNDPVILLGVLGRMRKLEGKGLKYSSPEFNNELVGLENSIKDSFNVNLSSRGCNRNLIRNSGQYWRALGLIPSNRGGFIELTEFGRKVADGDISQSQFAAFTIRSFKLPNPYTASPEERKKWRSANLEISPLTLILSIVRFLHREGCGWLTANELAKIVIPLAGTGEKDIKLYADHILDFREDPEKYSCWPNCVTKSNDKRMVREYLLFLDRYSYLIADNKCPGDRFDTHFSYNNNIDEEISDILSDKFSGLTSDGMSLLSQQIERIAESIDAKRMLELATKPGQSAFRKQVLDRRKICIITHASMPEILQAAHIKPLKYNGPSTVDNGFALRMDIHRLFDTNHLKISPEGVIELTQKARNDYGSIIPPSIEIPDEINKDYLKWRWENYAGLY